VVDNKGDTDLVNMLGFNFRITELQAAIGIEQLKKLDEEVSIRQQYAKMYNDALTQFDFIEASTFKDRTHSYYVQAFRFNEEKAGVSRNKYIEAVKAELMPVEKRENEGVPISCGYVKPIYLLSIFQKKWAYKDQGFGFKESIDYQKGLCQNVEELHYKELFSHDFTRTPLTKDDVNDVINAYIKVAQNLDELKSK
ncbi:MAG: DegT/DnrJ/EryC1/StrS family aminotransferase, partial [Campylobacterales bacterium]|nr:DegT/DnrJ/EryC1/StrS family aminotransferase [Campylobacterales bacterium]